MNRHIDSQPELFADGDTVCVREVYERPDGTRYAVERFEVQR
ncbi:hypothetical protein I5H06_gp24 [Mycobacterium phage SirPhilip]|uniref:Uncharacterized protein n=1 Tax=Mycobacterium phage SirPhilip TaxID=2015824 RepID=A0A222ZMM9_9CAUD|nr:hypothetical protein I5H06_gp24 [Mycobacterium phage SirPhilip]ASR85280.1 hypothetical protein SEA_SIRPHILIP_78 [Mycobacterium phage SirPhilip]